jgi:uncharacterized membrane protein
MGLDLLSQYEIPYLHPLAVHFPLVLLLLGAAAAAFYLLLGTPTWRVAALILVALGTATAWWASETGEDLEHAMEGEPIVEQIVHTHEDAAEWTLWAGGLATVVLGLATGWVRLRRPRGAEGEPAPAPTREPLWLRLLVVIPAAAAAILVAWTAHLGGLMVWGVPTG